MAAVGARPDRAVRSQLPQVDRARPGADRRHPDLPRPAAQPLRDHRPDSAGAAEEGGDQDGDQGEPARHRRASTPGRSTRSSPTPPTTGSATTPGAWRSCSIRASTASTSTRLVRLRAVQPDLPRPPRHARRPEGPQGADGVRHALHAQAARGALAGLAAAHPRRAQPDPARAVQRVVHDARLDVAVLPDHRVERHHRGDDGRPRRPGAHRRVDRGGGGVPPDDGPRAPPVREQEATGSSTPGTRTR